MGLEFRDSTYSINAKNGHALRTDMVLNLALGFQDIDEGNGRK
jgi:nucleosome binding factor SPN SPT16 subunit